MLECGMSGARADKYCYECAAVIARSATSCTACSAPQPDLPELAGKPAPPDHGWDLSHMLLAAGALVLIAVGASSPKPRPAAPAAESAASAPPSAPPPPPPTSAETEAWTAARRLVLEHLRAPPTAQFANDHHITRIGAGRYEVSSYFQMANTSGDMVRTNWSVQILRHDGAWQIERLEAHN